VTVGGAFGNSAFDHDRKLNRKHWLDACGGYFTEHAATEVISTDGVRCFVATEAATKSLSEDAA
jgi:hypothetical protein